MRHYEYITVEQSGATGLTAITVDVSCAALKKILAFRFLKEAFLYLIKDKRFDEIINLRREELLQIVIPLKLFKLSSYVENK